MFFSFTISVHQGTKIAFKNAIFLDCFQSAKPSNFRAPLNRRENVFLDNIFTSLCCSCDAKHTFKRSF